MGTPPKTASVHRIWLGRSRELAELEAGLDELGSGRGSVFLVTGEPGIGKTRLADEVSRAAVGRGMSVHWGRAWEAGGAPAYWPFTQVLRSISRQADPLADLVGRDGTPLERFQLFEAVDEFLRRAETVPRLVVLDDLHAADPSSLQLLHFIVRDLRTRPLMVIGTYRDAEARLAAEVTSLLAQVAREACVLPLRRLDRREVAAYVTLALGADPSDDRIEDLHRQTEGNPLFLRELLQLHGSPSRSSDGIREVVRARLALLAPDTRRTLEAASVLGREFMLAPLALLSGVSELDARALLEPAASTAIIEPLDEPPRWRFTHVLLRQGLYDDLPAERRAGLHREAAAELKRRPGGPPLAELSHHLLNAVPLIAPAEAGRAALDAAARAMELLAFEDARQLYASAEKLLAQSIGPELFEAVLGAGLSHMRAAEVERGKLECARAAELARRLGASDLFARAVLASAYEFAPDVRDQPLIAALEEALQMLPQGDSALRARCMAQLAAERQPEPDTGPAMELAREGLAMARRVGDVEALRFTLSATSLALSLYADPAERQRINQEALRLASACDQRVALRAQLFLAADYLEQGDLVSAEVQMQRVHPLASALGHRRFDWLVDGLQALQRLLPGRFAEALPLYEIAANKCRHDEARGAALAAMPLLLACVTERYDNMAEIEAKVRATLAAIPDEINACLAEMLIAQLYGRAGDRVRAQVQLDRLAQHPLFASITEPVWLALVVDACHLVEDAELARRLYRALLPNAHRFALLGPLTLCIEPPYARQLGLLSETLGRLDDAVTHLEDAERRTDRARMRAHLARLRFELARALSARGRDGDRERASELAVQARALATELGQTHLLVRFGAAPLAPVSLAAPAFSLCREGDFWAITCGDHSARLRDSRGMQLLAALVTRQDQELHVLQLASGGESSDAGDAGVVLDAAAIQQYRRRLLELRETVEESEQLGDLGRTNAAREEMDFLTDELARAVGLGGRERRVGAAAERARTAVQKRLREAIRRVEDALPAVGRHLDQTIQTGLFCGYLPSGRRRKR